MMLCCASSELYTRVHKCRCKVHLRLNCVTEPCMRYMSQQNAENKTFLLPRWTFFSSTVLQSTVLDI